MNGGCQENHLMMRWEWIIIRVPTFTYTYIGKYFTCDQPGLDGASRKVPRSTKSSTYHSGKHIIYNLDIDDMSGCCTGTELMEYIFSLIINANKLL
jgi:hypothetical protein